MNSDYSNAVKFYKLGVQAAENRDFERAEHYLRKCLAVYPDYTEGWISLGLVLGEQGRIDEAIAAYRRAIDCDPTCLRAYVNLSFQLGKQDRWQETADVLFEALNNEASIVEHDSETAFSVFGNLASALRRLGLLEKSEEMYRRALQIRPSDTGCRNLLGVVLFEQGRYDEAEAEFRESIRCDPAFALGHYNLGLILRKVDRSQEAKESFLEAIRLQPDYADAYAHLLDLLDLLVDENHNAAAVEYLRHVLWIDPNNKSPATALGNALARMEPVEKIHLDLRDGIRKEDPSALRTYNSILRGELKVVWKMHGFGPLLYFIGSTP